MISTLASTKIVNHAIRAGDREIAGYLVGFVRERVFFILDAVEFPIIGSTSRIEIANEIGDKIHEYTANILETQKKVGISHNYVGWYHSHPGFGCWLSGIDVKTHSELQMANKMFLALVVDPFKTLSTRNIELGCFMTYFQDSSSNRSNFLENIPLNKSQEFGVHANKYYKLEHQFFESKFESEILKLLYKNYWTDTLSTNMINLNKEYNLSLLDDMSTKIRGLDFKSNMTNNDNLIQEIFLQKLQEIVSINTHTTVNLQNELIKQMIFNDD